MLSTLLELLGLPPLASEDFARLDRLLRKAGMPYAATASSWNDVTFELPFDTTLLELLLTVDRPGAVRRREGNTLLELPSRTRLLTSPPADMSTSKRGVLASSV